MEFLPELGENIQVIRKFNVVIPFCLFVSVVVYSRGDCDRIVHLYHFK